MRSLRAGCFVLGLLVLVPATAFAQASIAGVVKDTSGAVLPGVTVEASSPVLIEKVRSTVTDGSGQYRIVDLRAGIYTVTFTLTGFSGVKRDGIQLEGAFTAVVNADLKVGSVTETITVTADTPVVDTQSVRRQTVIGNDLITSIPAARAYAGLMTLMPNTVVAGGAASDVQVVPGMVVFGGAGGRSNEGRLQLDGLSVGSAFNGAGVSSYIADVGNAQEVTMTTSGGLGEAEVGGPSLNVVPKTGGNTVKGAFYASGVTKGMIGSNYTQELKDQGLKTPGSLTKVWDFNLGVGGPIRRDHVWYFGQIRDEGSHRTVPGMFANLNAGDASKWTYVADLTRPAAVAASFRPRSLRLTVQPTPRNNFKLFWDEQKPCEGAAFPGAGDNVDACQRSSASEIIAGSTAPPTPSASATLAPEIAGYRDYGNHVQQATWQSPSTNRLLLEAGVGGYESRYGGKLMPGSPAGDLVRVVENCARGCANNGNIAGLTYRSPNYSSNWQGSFNWRASATYVVGAQSMKFGYQGGYLVDSRKDFANNQFLQYRTQNGVPDQLSELLNRFPVEQRVRYDAFYAQDQRTFGRLTVQGALRFDHAWSFFPAASIGGVRFLPSVTTFPEARGVDSYKDLTPRGGVAYDLFGNGKTAIKVSVGKYLEAAQNGGNFSASRPTSRVSGTGIVPVFRTWTNTNKDFVPDCDLLNPLANRECFQLSDLNFGTPVFNTTQDPALLAGWGVRSSDWQIGASIQQELLPRVSAEVGYYRRWLKNFTVTDNLSQTPSDFGTFFITAPLDSRLPNGGAYPIPGPLYNVNQNVASAVNNLVTKASNYGNQTQYSNSVSLNLSARPRNGLMVQGGFNTAQTLADYCEIRAALPELNVPSPNPTNPIPTNPSPTNPYCKTNTRFITRFTALGSYTVPRIDVQVAGTIRSDQGDTLAANWAAPNSVIEPSLGRKLSNGAPNATVNLIEPGTLYGDRVNEIDLRLAKILRLGRTKTNVGVDIYNLMNRSPVLTYNQTFVLPSPTNPNGSWLTPTSVLQPRFFKISAQIDF